MWCRIAAMASLIGFYKVAHQTGSKSVRQTFPKCNSTHNDPVFQLKMPNSPIAKFILETCIDEEMYHSFESYNVFVGFVPIFCSRSCILECFRFLELKYQCKKVSTRVGTEERNQ